MLENDHLLSHKHFDNVHKVLSKKAKTGILQIGNFRLSKIPLTQ